MYIVFEFCICYNANRQREMRSPCSSTSKQKPRCSSTGVFYSYFLVWKGLITQAGYRLFVTVQPFDDVMANYTSRNSDNTNALFFLIITVAPTTISNPAAIGSIGMFPPVCGVSGTSRIGASLKFTVCTFPVSLIVNCIGFGS